MNRLVHFFVPVLLSPCLFVASAHASVSLLGHGEVVPPQAECVDVSRMPAGPPLASGSLERLESVLYPPSYAWPFERPLRDGLILGNYIDHDPTSAIRDYMNGSWSYDGHRGTDIVLCNFKQMDRGVRILSGASGVVSATRYQKVDRNTGPPYPDTENYVIVDNGDGSHTWYLHLRRNSVTVNPGEAVSPGTVLGLAGSSGYSTDAHLHFEVGQYTPGWTHRDPWNGPGNPLPSLWAAQEPYAGDQPLWIADMGVFTAAAVGGNLASFPVTYFKERISQPAVLGANETSIPVWLQIQGRAGDSYRLEIVRPDNSVYAFVNYTLPSKIQYGWHYWYWNWGNANVPPSTYGDWTARFLINSIETRRVTFTVGAATEYGPRFAPIGGRSFRINGVVQTETMGVSSLGGPVTYSLLNAPAGVTLEGSTLRVPASSSQAIRSEYFQVIATDQAARRDTAWYHLVDPAKPIDVPAGVEERAAIGALAIHPNPARVASTFDFVIQRSERVTLEIFDAQGREVRRLVDERLGPGAHRSRWDLRDSNGKTLGSGIYFLRLRGEGSPIVRRLAVVR